jgi:hypothetical protein
MTGTEMTATALTAVLLAVMTDAWLLTKQLLADSGQQLAVPLACSSSAATVAVHLLSGSCCSEKFLCGSYCS